MARISEFYQRGDPDQIEIAITPQEHTALGAGSDDLKLRLSTFTRAGAESKNYNIDTAQSKWTFDKNTNEYYIIIPTNQDGNHNGGYNGIALGSVGPSGQAAEVYDAYMVGTFGGKFNPEAYSDTVTSSSWIPVGTKFTDIDQSKPTGSGGQATVRWDAPDINTPIVSRAGGLKSTGSAPVCLAAGTKILTDKGEIKVEQLQVGDLVATMDRGFQPIKWLHSESYDRDAMAESEKFYPVKIEKDSIKRGCPSTDLRTSRQHRILVKAGCTPEKEYLVPAIKLTQFSNVEIDKSCRDITYFHILFDQHEVIIANNMAVESLLLGPFAAEQLGYELVQEASESIANLSAISVPARPLIETKSEVRELGVMWGQYEQV